MDNEEKSNWKKGGRHTRITAENLLITSIYYTVRKIIPATWLNDRDQFLYPNDGWKNDIEFQNDCLAFTLFHSQNRVSNNEGINHWIPFTEQEVNAKEKFASNFMTDFIKGKIKPEEAHHLFSSPSPSLRGLGGVKPLNELGGVKHLKESEGVIPLNELGGVKPTITKQYLQQHHINTENLIFSNYYLPYNPNLKEKSKSLRKGYILSETLLWKQLRADSFMGLSFYRQKPILNYIADFYCKELGLVIEIDGSSHDTEKAILYDKERDRQMSVLGLRILRVRDADVKNNMVDVLEEIKKFITHNNPLKEEIKSFISPPNPIKEEIKNFITHNNPLKEEIKSFITPPNPLIEETKSFISPPNPLIEETKSFITHNNPLKEGEEDEERIFSAEAKAVFEAGRELWKYYHSFNAILPNASLYDIREFFQGRNDKGRMNAKSSDETYTMLIGELRSKLNLLAQKITPKVYEYGFLKE